ncbi:hypothetical protein KGO95_04300 [Patescibacteria group bacterium]|nr:hypothetical protein [Patescibacteria group bacterium]
MDHIIGLKELRENVEQYASAVKSGKSFTVVRKSKPLFKISPVGDDEHWEEVIDLTKIKKGGVDIKDLISRL